MPDSPSANPFDFVGVHDFKPPRDLLDWEASDISDEPGAYIFVGNKSFTYPLGTSPMFYIGQAVNLRKRLYRHKKAITQAGGERPHAIYRPVTEYAAQFGANVAILPCSKYLPKDFEFLLLVEFLKQFHAMPVANNAVNWRKVRQELKRQHVEAGEP